MHRPCFAVGIWFGMSEGNRATGEPLALRQPLGAAVIRLRTDLATTDAETYLTMVDRRLADTAAALDQTWQEILQQDHLADDAPLTDRPDILGEHDLPELIRALASGGGKRIRPLMAFHGWLAAGGARREVGLDHVVSVGAALELLHVFGLVHDDVMDESNSRRGKPSVHALATQLHLHAGARGSARRFGESVAILVGDLAHAEADELIADLPSSLRRLWRLLVIELVRGQSRDLTGSAAGRRDLAQAREVARMKSGGYTVERPLQLGAAAAEASPRATQAIAAYGREVGEAFALRDDLLGIWGDPGLTGKPAGDDLLSGKPTVIVALAHDLLPLRHHRLLARVGTNGLSAADVVRLQEALQEGGVVEAVEQRISDHVQAAVDQLGADLDPRGVAGLIQMAHRVAWRDR